MKSKGKVNLALLIAAILSIISSTIYWYHTTVTVGQILFFIFATASFMSLGMAIALSLNLER